MTEHLDVLVVGAGISGIGAAYHLTQQRPGTTFAVLEAQTSFGGTWRTHTYPGIRSDSDLYTFGYRFKPWIGPPIATADEIRAYLGEVIDENDLERHIRYCHTIDTAEWSSEDRRWTVRGRITDGDRSAAAAHAGGDGEPFTLTAGFLFMCQGYYRHTEGYTPDWPGMDRFAGEIVHPISWPDDLDYDGREIVVIGSGATAATIIPAMADRAGHITMLQRSPTYFRAGRNANEIADLLRQVDIPEEWIHEIVRRRIMFEMDAFTKLCFSHPNEVKAEMLNELRQHLKPELQHLIDTDFSPSYDPWKQRIAFVPDGDLFRAINDGKVDVVTGEIDTFTESGLVLTSGRTLDADLIITATGFQMSALGDIDFTVDGTPLDFANTVGYHGTMFTGVPNLAWVFGYFRASWTLRADLIADFVCRLLDHMDARDASMVVPTLRPTDAGMERRPWVDLDDFDPGYVRRGLPFLPHQGDRPPWQHTQDYWTEKDTLPLVDLDDGLVYS